MPTLPPKLTAGEVIAQVNALWNSAPMEASRANRIEYRANVFMRGSRNIPDDYAEGNRMPMDTTRVMRVMRIMKTDTASYPRYTDALALSPKTGVPTQAMQTKADKLGRKLTLMNATLDANRQVTDPSRDRQLADGDLVWVLHKRKKSGGGFRYEIEVADANTCAFDDVEGGCFQPKRLGRKYRQTVRWLKGRYDNSGRNKGKELSYDDTGPVWVSMSAARSLDDGPAHAGSTSGGQTKEQLDQEVEVVTWDDGCWIYHVVCNKAGADGEMLYCERNTTFPKPAKDSDEPEYAAAAVVIAGDTFAIGGDGEKRLPVLFSLIQIASCRNMIRELRNIRVLSPDRPIIVTGDFTPDQLMELQQRGAIVPVGEDDGSPGGFAYAAGNRAQQFERASIEDLQRIAEELKLEEDECVSEMLTLVSPDVTATATAQGIVTQTSAAARQKTNWLQNLDGGWVIADTLICNATLNDDEEYSFVARQEIQLQGGGKIAKGELAEMTPDDVDFPFEVHVGTTEETEDQKNRQLLNRLYLFSQDVITWDEVLEAWTPDVAAQNKRLTIDYARRIAQPVLLRDYLPGIIEEGAALSGVLMPLVKGALMPQGPVAPGAPDATGGDTAAPASTTYQPAAMEPSAGGAGGGL